MDKADEIKDRVSSDEQAYESIGVPSLERLEMESTPRDGPNPFKELMEDAVQQQADHTDALWEGFVVEMPREAGGPGGFISELDSMTGNLSYHWDIQYARIFRTMAWIDFWRNFNDAELIPVEIKERSDDSV